MSEFREQSREVRQQIAEAVADGLKLGEAANQFNCSLSQVRNCCKENGVTINRQLTREEEMTVLSKLINTDWSIVSIAKDLEICPITCGLIHIAAKQAGIEMPVRKRGRPYGSKV